MYSRYDDFVRIRHLKLKSSHKHRHQAPQLGDCKVVSDAAPRSMQEGEVGVVALRPSRIVRFLCTGLSIDIDPSLRPELFGVVSPKSLVPVDGPWREDHLHAGGNGVSCENGRPHGVPVDDIDGGIQPQRLAAGAIEKGKTLQYGCELVAIHWLARRRDTLVNLRAESSLDLWVLGEQVGQPRECYRRGAVPGGEDCEELVHELLVSQSGRGNEM